MADSEVRLVQLPLSEQEALLLVGLIQVTWGAMVGDDEMVSHTRAAVAVIAKRLGFDAVREISARLVRLSVATFRNADAGYDDAVAILNDAGIPLDREHHETIQRDRDARRQSP